MVDKTVGRIDHSACTHPDTAHARRKCREQKLEDAHTERKREALAEMFPKGKAKAPVPDVTTLAGTIASLDEVADTLSNLGDVGYMHLQVTLIDGTTLDAQLAEDWSWALTVVA